jgi:hypothetical protein
MPEDPNDKASRKTWPSRSIACVNESIKRLIDNSQGELRMTESEKKLWLRDPTTIPYVKVHSV